MYTQQQTVFVLSMFSNLAITQKGTVDELEEYLARRIDVHLQASAPDIGVWTRVWGPAVFQAPLSNVTDNVMYVARSSTTPPQYVVALAGTNYNSAFDVLIEDLFVSKQVAWGYGNPPDGAAISAGTFTGLTMLQFLIPGPTLPGATQTLTEFLGTVVTQQAQIITAGHSLGGALSPALALWLLNTQAEWDPQGRATLFCQPSAGPTPGNAPFAQYYDQLLGSRTNRLWNGIDIVPHAWEESDLGALPTLYNPAIPPDAIVDALVGVAEGMAEDGAYTQLNEATKPLPGTINASLIDPSRLGIENYLIQAGYQHIDEYFTLLQVSINAEVLAAVQAGMGIPAAKRAAVRLRAQLERRGAISAAMR
jgi:hypothetical protein